MSVLVEAISVILKASSIEARYTGGLPDFAHFCRRINNSYCTDGELVRIGFTKPEDVQGFVEKMNFAGLVYFRDGPCIDLAVADQHKGFMRSCPWAVLDHAAPQGAPDRRVATARLVGGKAEKLVVPERWTYHGSISARPGAPMPPAPPVPAKAPPFAVFAPKPGDAASLAMAMRRKKT